MLNELKFGQIRKKRVIDSKYILFILSRILCEHKLFGVVILLLHLDKSHPRHTHVFPIAVSLFLDVRFPDHDKYPQGSSLY